MDGFIIRVAAHHGEPMQVGSAYARNGTSEDTPVKDVVNDPRNDVVLDIRGGSRESTYTLDDLIDDFQDEFRCKVNYEDTVNHDGLRTFEFDIFEPSWSKKSESKNVIEDLTARLIDWVSGYPSGR